MPTAKKSKKIKRSTNGNSRSDIIFIIVALAFPIINFLVYFVGMNAGMFSYAFETRNMENQTVSFIGSSYPGGVFHNFRNVFRVLFGIEENGDFGLNTLLRTFSVALISIINIPIGLLLAFGVFRKYFGYKVNKVVIYAPAIVSSIVTCLCYKMLFSDTGPIMQLLKAVDSNSLTVHTGIWGNTDISWLLIMLFSVWMGVQGHFLYYLSAMSSVSQEILESAKIDGATEGHIFRKICVPLVWPTIVTLSMGSIAGCFAWFMPALLITEGNFETNTIGLMITQFIKSNKEDYMLNFFSALGVVITIFGTITTLLTQWIGNKFNYQEN